MRSIDPRHRRRWPLLIVAGLLVLIDLFAILVFIAGAVDTTDTDGKAIGLVITGVVVALLTWSTWLCIRAFARRGRPEVVPPKQPFEMMGVRPPVISTGRKVGGMALAVVFLGLAAIIIGVVISQLVSGHISGQSGGITGGMVCAAVGFAGFSIARTPSSAERARFLGEVNRAGATGVAPGYGAEPCPPPAGYPGQQPYGAAPPAAPSWMRVPVDREVTYRESCSEFPWPLVLGCIASSVLLIWSITVSPAWLVAVCSALLALPVILLIAAVMFVPYGIRLAGGTLSIGVQGVPRIGRGWKRQELPLEEVIAWTVCPRTRAKTEIPRSPFPDGDLAMPPASKRIGNWGNFTGPGVRNVLVVRVDPARVPAAMPAVVMMGYGVQDAGQTARDIGVYVIGTHRRQRLVQALDKAMPSRRSLA